MKEIKGEYCKIPLEAILENYEFQCRDTPWEVDDLVASIKQDGQLDPVLVRPLGEKFQLICGFRRYTALKKLGYKWIQARVMNNLNDQEARRISVTENLDRHDLSSWDKVATAARYHREGMKSIDIADIFRVKERTIQRYLRTANSPDDFKRALQRNDITINQCYEAVQRNIPLNELTGHGRSVRYLRGLSHNPRKREEVSIRRKSNGEIIINIVYHSNISDISHLFSIVQERLKKYDLS